MASYSSLWADGVHFTYDPGAYHQHTVVYATLVDGSKNPVDMSNLLLGAYIGDVCRGEAAYETPPAGSDFFTMNVGGDDGDIDLPITFRVYDTTTQKEYILPDANVTFQGDDKIGEASTPLQITFIPAGEITLTETSITVHCGQEVNLDSYVTSFATGVAVPSYSWMMPIADDAEFISLKGSTLQGLKVTTIPATVNVVWGTSVVRLTVYVDAPATAAAFKAEYDEGLTVAVGNTTDITNAIENGWTLTPADATTTFTWMSDDPSVVSFNDTNGEWTANAVGFATITGTANDDSGLGLKLSVNVVQPVTALLLSSTTITAEVGEDITARLNALVTPDPGSATNPGFTWSIVSGDGKVTIESGTIRATAITELGSPAVVKATADDGFGATAQVNVNVVAQQPTALAPIQDPLSFTNDPLNPNRDITAEVIANVQVTPDGPLLTDYNPQFASTDPNVVEVVTTTPTPTLTVRGGGTTTITVTITKKDYTNINPTTGDPADVPLSTSFQVVITNGVASFTFDNVEMTRSGSYQLTLTPKPDGCEYNPEKISISITPDDTYPFPTGWNYVGAAATDKSKLIWDLTAHSVGKGTVEVMYDGKLLGTGTVNVSQQLTLNDGWQWIALHEGSIGDLTTMEKLFGANMDDMRSQDALLINDSQFGYFGALTSMTIQQTYKLKMKNLGSGGMTCTVPGNGYAQLANGSGYAYNTRVGWNWIGNPYQYYQKLDDALAGNSFTSGDMVKGKIAFATYTGSGWSGSLTHFIPGEGVLLKVNAAGTVVLHSEYDFNQNTTPALARASYKTIETEPWTIDDSRFDDNMALIASVSGVNDESKVCVWAFVGDECRGRSVFDDGRHFITIHGTTGETVRFLTYDGCTNAFHEVPETIRLAESGGSFDNPVILHEGGVVTAIDRVVGETAPESSAPVYNLEGRRVNHSSLKKGIYIQQGKKIIK